MIQYDFAKKLLSKNQDRRAISVLSQSCFDMKILRKIGKENFSPPPKINSVVMEFKRKSSISKQLIQSVNLIFSFRRKKVQTIGKYLGLEIKSDINAFKQEHANSMNEMKNMLATIIEKQNG